MGFINISNNTKASKDRYIDPRKRGQYKDPNSGNYVTPYGRDKSGYEIPNPADKLKKLYQIDLDNYAKVLDRYYKKINNLKSQVFDIDFKSKSSGYRHLLDTLGDLTETYAGLVNDIDGSIRSYNKLPSERQTPEMFSQILDWNYNYRNINKLIVNLTNELKEFK